MPNADRSECTISNTRSKALLTDVGGMYIYIMNLESEISTVRQHVASPPSAQLSTKAAILLQYSE